MTCKHQKFPVSELWPYVAANDSLLFNTSALVRNPSFEVPASLYESFIESSIELLPGFPKQQSAQIFNRDFK